MEIKIKHGTRIYHKWHWVRRVPIRLQHKYGTRIDKSTGLSDPYAAERQIQAWDSELERSGLTTSTAEDYQAELKRIAALEVDEMGNNEVDLLVVSSSLTFFLDMITLMKYRTFYSLCHSYGLTSHPHIRKDSTYDKTGICFISVASIYVYQLSIL